MLVIRLARTGKKKQAYFRVVVAEKQRAVGAKFVEILGNYNPHDKKLTISDKEKLLKYLRNGACPSNTLAKLLNKEGIELPKWVTIAERNRPPKVKDKDKKEEATEEKAGTSKENEGQGKEEKTEEPKETKEEEKVEEAKKETSKEEKGKKKK